jgi:hypothetical protein
MIRHWVAILAVIGHQPRSDVYEMELPEIVWWVNDVADLYLTMKGIDPFSPGV